ncbi:hypothetical protein [Pseudomonas sp. RC10]|uniref:hypothetical protein n=1 Tax=Pseudomonas bambusae TaxID=3139142 RepID=UPI003139CE4E
MNRVLAALLICASFNAGSVVSIAHTVASQASTFANATLCESLKVDHSPFGLALDKQCRNRQRVEFDELQDRKPLQDCIKPGNVIDDDVRKCVKGI